MSDCLFCRIAAGEVPAQMVHQDAHIVAFRDIAPKAPVHILVVPRHHWTSLAAVPDGEAPVLGHLLEACRDLAVGLGLGDGYRVVVNTGPDGGQTVDHLHVHLLGGRAMEWPPG